MPAGYRKQGVIWKLQKALYGLRRSPLLWYKLLRSALEKLGLHALHEDSCVLTNGWITVFFHVDDINIMFHPRDQAEAEKLIENLKTCFQLTGGNPIANFLKIGIARNLIQRKLWLCQREYIVLIAQRFGLDLEGWSRQPSTPLPQHDLPPRNHDLGIASHHERRIYLQKIGSALYPACLTRPDIAFAVAFLAQFCVNPATAHRLAADHLIRYLLATQWLGLLFDGNDSDLIAYADASFADDQIDRRSSQGYVFLFFGAPVLWKANKQAGVTTSSTEAEIRAASEAASYLIALGRLFDEISLDLNRGLELLGDNLQTIRALSAQTHTISTRIRHVDIHQHWLRQEVLAGTLSLGWVNSKDMAADGLTKRLSTEQHAQFVRQLRLADCRDAFKARAD
jgi:hypothetical protein